MTDPVEPRRIDISDSEVMMINPNTLLVSEYESAFADTARIGVAGSEGIAWLATFTGRINNTDRQEVLTVSMHPDDAWRFLSMLLDQFEHFAGVKDMRTGKPGPNAQRFKAAKNRRKRKR